MIKAVGDHTGSIVDDTGLDVPALWDWVATHGGVAGFETGRPSVRVVSADDLFAADVDVFVPAALENQVTAERAGLMRAKVIIEAANGPTTPEAETTLAANEVEVIPDILANAGGVIVSYCEWLQNKAAEVWSEEEVDERLRTLLWDASDEVVAAMGRFGCSRREAAYVVSLRRLENVYSRRDIFP